MTDDPGQLYDLAWSQAGSARSWLRRFNVDEVRLADKIDARSDDDEYETTIIVYQDFIDGRIPGMKETRTIDGYACSRIDDDTFQVVNGPLHPEIIVRRIR